MVELILLLGILLLLLFSAVLLLVKAVVNGIAGKPYQGTAFFAAACFLVILILCSVTFPLF